jgi:bifunctional non-homologous end joining protein LigD
VHKTGLPYAEREAGLLCPSADSPSAAVAATSRHALRCSPTASSRVLAPCLPTLAREVPDGPQWAHEVKHDGYRFICRRAGDRVRVFSRNALDWTDKVPAIVEALAALRCTSVTLDGEAVMCDPATGISDFDALRLALARREGSRAAFLFAFDPIELDGQDLRAEPWQVRRETLASLLRGTKRDAACAFPST